MLQRTMKTLFTSATGLPAVLWFIVAYIITDIPNGEDGDFIMLLGAMLTGIGLQVGMYRLSQRSFLTIERSKAFVWSMVVIATFVSLMVLAAVSWDLYVYRHHPASGMDRMPLTLSSAMAVLLLSSGFRSRLNLIRMRTDYRSHARVARQASRLLVPVGPFSINRVIRTLDEMAARNGTPLPLARRLDQFVDEFRVRGDSRYARSVPWASGVCVVQAYVQMRADRVTATTPTGTTTPPIIFRREENLDHIRLRPALVCSLLDVATGENEGVDAPITLRTIEREGNLVIQIRGANLERRRVYTAAREVNLALEAGIVLDHRRGEQGISLIELICPPTAPQRDFSWTESLPGDEEARVLSHSRFSNGVKQSIRSNGLVIRAQRLDMLDPKPTLIEDEYLIMRRLMDASGSFPRVVGCGTKDNVQWLSYYYEPGVPLIDWLANELNRPQWFRVIAEVDNMIRTMRENAVAHRDLNPGNIIVRGDGSLALIDFDQAVADDDRFATADVNGVDSGYGKNDIGMFIERCGLTRQANHAIQTLGEAWQQLLARKTMPQNFIKSPYQFDFAGQTFPGWVPWYDEWQAIAALGDFRGKKVLNIGGGLGLLDTFLAVSGAEVTSVESQPELLDAARAIAEAAQVDVRFDPAAVGTLRPGQYDLLIAIGSGLEPGKTDWLKGAMKEQPQILAEIAGSLQDARKLVEDMGWVWRGVAAYSPRLCPLVAIAHPQHLKAAGWLKAKTSSEVRELVHA